MKEVFIFGAGASNASARTPLGHELVWKYYQDRRQLYEINNDGSSNLTEEDKECANYSRFLSLAEETYPELQDVEKRWKDERKENWAFKLPDLNKNHYVDEMVKILQERKNNEGVKLVRQLVLEHITEPGMGYPNLLYEAFVKELIPKFTPENIAIISMNFDYFLESSFVDKNYFDYFDYGIDFDKIDSTNYKKNGISLIKLHGSLNWGICLNPKCSKVILLGRTTGKKEFKDRKCECEAEITPLIFLPNEEKISSIYQKLKKLTEGILQQASKVTVIGYSFPEYDEDISNLFRQFTNHKPLVGIVDYELDAGKRERREKEILAKCKCIFKDCTIKIFLDGFQKYLSDRIRMGVKFWT